MHTLAQAKRDHSIGFLTKYRIERRAPGSSEWSVALGEGNASGWLVDARTKAIRNFKTLDAAVRAVEEIGFEVNTLA